METKGLVFHLQRFSTDDGGGIRTCVFLKGCPLRCLWCHNAEGLSPSPEIAFYQASCIGCGGCAAVCPQGALSLQKGKARLDRSRCVACGVCASACPTGALTQVGSYMSVEEVLSTVRRDRPFYGKTGGMTITGGEPLAQAAFTLALAKAAKAEGISVAIETCGHGKTEDMLALLPYCDHFLFDCKASATRHAALTGVNDRLILQNLTAICEGGATVTLRCPIIQGANMEDAFTEKVISLAASLPGIRAVQLMPYHNTGRGKTAAIGKAPQEAFAAPDETTLSRLAAHIEKESGKRTFY